VSIAVRDMCTCRDLGWEQDSMWFLGIQDLLAATLEIPFSVPPYMALLARSVATLEGIALTGDPSYQMVAQVCFLSLYLVPLVLFLPVVSVQKVKE
jgi:predicted unusual protein kinase regulating ubiquinone biosynthesis (AarF/ABC1/UbiB family)